MLTEHITARTEFARAFPFLSKSFVSGKETPSLVKAGMLSRWMSSLERSGLRGIS